MRAAHAARVGELEDPLGARVERPVHRMAEARAALPPAAWIAARSLGDGGRVVAGATRACASLEQARALARRCRGSPGPQPRIPAATAPCSEPGSAASVIRAATLRRHHPVLGDRDEQQVEEEALLVGRLAPVSSRWKYSVKLSRPIRSPQRSRPRTSTRSG